LSPESLPNNRLPPRSASSFSCNSPAPILSRVTGNVRSFGGTIN
jgi:hypothetical protein